MTYPIKIIFPGEVKTKSNKLFFRRGRTYIPENVVAWENNLKIEAIKAMQGAPPLACPVKVTARIYRSNKRKCDLGNYNKSAFDALNGVVYVDDYLICEEHMFKLLDKDNPRIELDIEPFVMPQWSITQELPLVLPDQGPQEEDDSESDEQASGQHSSGPKANPSKKIRKKHNRRNGFTKKRKVK